MLVFSRTPSAISLTLYLQGLASPRPGGLLFQRQEHRGGSEPRGGRAVGAGSFQVEGPRGGLRHQGDQEARRTRVERKRQPGEQGDGEESAVR